MKYIITLLSLVIASVLWNTAVAQQPYDFQYGRLYYKITAAGEAAVSPQTVTYNDNTRSYFRPGEVPSGHLEIPAVVFFGGSSYQVTAISDNTFAGCSGITSVTIPAGLRQIGKRAFEACTGLTKVQLPASLTRIAELSFAQCSRLAEVQVDPACPHFTSHEGVLYNKAKTILRLYPAGRPGTAFVVPDGVQHISYAAFYKCNNLTSVTLPSTLTLLHEAAFSICDGLRNLIVRTSTPPTVFGSTFQGVMLSNVQLDVPIGSGADYKAADVWKWFAPIVESIAAPPSLTVSRSEVNMAAAGSAETVQVRSNIDNWTATPSATWITVTPSTGSRTASIRVNAEANPQPQVRTGNVRVTGGGITRLITVTQAPSATIGVHPQSMGFGPSGGTQKILITAPGAWTATPSAAWISATPAAGAGNTEIAITTALNTQAVARTGSVVVSDGIVTRTVAVSQQAASTSGGGSGLSVQSMTFSNAGGSQSFTVAAKSDWAIHSSVPWLTLTPLTGNGSRTITATVAANPGETRTATITFNSAELIRTITVTQYSSASPFVLIVTPALFENVPGNGTTQTLSILTNTGGWTAVSADPWISITPASGVNDGTAALTVQANSTGIPRTGTITVRGGSLVRTVAVQQQGVAYVPQLTVAPLNIKFDHNGGTQAFSVLSNTAWSVASAEPWLTMAPLSGNGNGAVAVTAAPNPDAASRIGTIAVTAGGVLRTVTVTVNDQTSIADIDATISAYRVAERLYVNSPSAETIDIYTPDGILLQHTSKSAGEASFTLDRPGVVIIKGGTGWSKKATDAH